MEIEPGLTGPAFEYGYEIAEDRGLAIVGLSPGNSYFKKGTIHDLIKSCASAFDHVRIMIADTPSEHTYKAMGYTPEKAVRKARLNGNTLQNHCQRTIAEGLGDVRLVEWKAEIETHESYRRERRRIESMYRENSGFNKEARETTRTVLQGRLSPGAEIESAIDEGVFYLLKELAFLSASPEIFGTQRIAYVYHARWGVYEHFLDGTFDGTRRSDLGFVIVR